MGTPHLEISIDPTSESSLQVSHLLQMDFRLSLGCGWNIWYAQWHLELRSLITTKLQEGCLKVLKHVRPSWVENEIKTKVLLLQMFWWSQCFAKHLFGEMLFMEVTCRCSPTAWPTSWWEAGKTVSKRTLCLSGLQKSFILIEFCFGIIWLVLLGRYV